MKRDKDDPQVVELTEAEQVVHEWYMSLLDVGYGHHEAAERILTCVPIDKATWNVLNNQQFRDWLAGSKGPHDRPEICGSTLTVGTTDPSSTECDLKPGHYPETSHEGDDPLGVENLRVRWNGGGSCAGDPLPVTIVEWPRKQA